MITWKPTPEQASQYERDGYCILPNLITRDEAMMIKGIILNHVLQPDAGSSYVNERDPMDPMNASTADGRAARFRKLNGFGPLSPVLWHTVYANERVLAVARYFQQNDNLVLKFSSTFLKPARTGGATPWHQDNGLWRDGEITPFNMWMAIDAATKENGCLQFIPGSHRLPIIPHLLYPGGVHGEIPRGEVRRAIAEYGLHHIELEPGSAVCWHSNLYHYSPPNESDKSRIAVAAVICTEELAAGNPHHRQCLSVLKDGVVRTDYPPVPFTGYRCPQTDPAPYPPAPAEELAAA